MFERKGAVAVRMNWNFCGVRLFFRWCAKCNSELVEPLSMGLIQIPTENHSTEVDQEFLRCLIRQDEIAVSQLHILGNTILWEKRSL